MGQRTVTTILFDWDGTLCDSAAASLRAFRKSLGEFEITFTDAEYKAMFTPAWYRMYVALGLPERDWRKADERWLHYYNDEAPELLPGASVMLEALRERHVQTGIVTSGTRARIEREFSRLGVNGAFQAVVCYEDVVEKKPHPEGLHRALALVGSRSETCWYVGDTPEDIRMGKNAGMFTVGVPSDYIECSRMEECTPDVMLQTIGELPAVLDRLAG